MSDAMDAAGSFADALSGQVGNDPSGQPTDASVQGQQGDPSAAPSTFDVSGLSPQAQNWLAQQPEANRQLAAEHVRSWDQGFQQYAQKVQGQLSPYTQLGSVEELTQARNIVENLKADPQGFVQFLVDNGLVKLPGSAAPAEQQAPQYFDAQGNPVQVPQQQPPNFVEHPEFKRLQQALGVTAQQLQSMRSAQEAREQDQALENMMVQAEQKHGSFNRMYVYQMMAQGLTVDAAVQAWKNELAQYAQTQKPAPAVMSSTSAPPPAPGPLNTSDERTAALAQMLQGLQQN